MTLLIGVLILVALVFITITLITLLFMKGSQEQKRPAAVKKRKAAVKKRKAARVTVKKDSSSVARRRKEGLELYTGGKTKREIARQLGVTPKAVNVWLLRAGIRSHKTQYSTDFKVGVRIGNLRKAKKLTTGELATLVGSTCGMICSWERGDGLPSLEYLFEIAKAFDVSAEYLARGDAATKAAIGRVV